MSGRDESLMLGSVRGRCAVYCRHSLVKNCQRWDNGICERSARFSVPEHELRCDVPLINVYSRFFVQTSVVGWPSLSGD